MLEKIEKALAILAFKQAIATEKSILIEGLSASQKSILSELIQKWHKRNILIITGGARENNLYNDLCFFDKDKVLEFPSWETLPEEKIPTSYDVIGDRMEILHTLTHKEGPFFVLSSLQGILQKVPPKTISSQSHYEWKKNDQIAFDELDIFLTSIGYEATSIVTDKGQFAKRGGILDIFSASATTPYRIEFFGDEIDNIRIFDPVSQKSIEKVSKATLCPCNELMWVDKKTDTSLLDYLGEDTIILFDDLVAIEDNYVVLKKLIPPQSPYFISFNDFLQRIANNTKILLTKEPINKLSDVKILEKPQNKYFQRVSLEIFQQSFFTTRYFHPFFNVEDFISLHADIEENIQKPLVENLPILFKENVKTHFLNENIAEEKNIQEKIHKNGISLPENSFFSIGYLSSGFIIPEISYGIITSSDFSHKQKLHRKKWRNTVHTPAAEFHHLEPGDIVVHFHSGIGKFIGIEKQKNHLGVESEYLLIEYAKNSKLYVPISQAHLVSRYIGTKEDETTSYSTLGSTKWQKTKLQAQKQIIGYAADLLALYAERSQEKGFAYQKDSDEMNLFELDFPYEETPDQKNAILEIKQDMISKKPMDRLICGDVGYGKTEVAMRGAFKAVIDGKKQVAVLVPTTVLAMQHYDSFSERMKDYGVIIEMISRFQTIKQNKEVLQRVKEGKVDILIGTHRVLSKDVLFKDLGLIIIDEEQRFGVRAKEHIKKLKTHIECLTLSATPIPRTLYMSLITIRDMSVISTPPQDRLPTKTIIASNEDEIIKNAILREMSRDGQIFFIHNRVESIFSRASHIEKLIPNARIAVVHGQMDPDPIEKIFHEYKEGKYDILFATTIVENGVDVPNANTILIDRADTFGLADLYQLRGRVGRWNRAAYAYFLVPKDQRLSEIARKRLNALLEAGGYGGGMKIAMRDLEIRGAGDVLGTQQSGQVIAIGFHLYCKLLKRTIESLKTKKTISFSETKVELPYDARLPEYYIKETNLRMELYYRLGEVSSFDDIEEILQELKDRFGPFPQEVIWLYHLARIRVFGSTNHFTLIKLNRASLIIEQKLGKKATKKTFLFPLKLKDPQEIEDFMIDTMKKNFYCAEV